jgi:hypothetical protein
MTKLTRGCLIGVPISLALWTMILTAGCLLCTGCTSTLTNAGDVGFRYSTEFAFFHRAAKTSGSGDDNVARTNTEFPALVSWFLEGPPPEGAVVVTPQ